MILSFDIGIQHLSYCLYNNQTKEILDWDVVSLLSAPCNPEELFPAMEGNLYFTAHRLQKEELKQLYGLYSLSYNTKISKAVMVETLEAMWKHKNVKKVCSTDLDYLSVRLFVFLETLYEKWSSEITSVLIENQPCLKNPTMKSLQIMVFSFFKLKHLQSNVVFVSANKKTKKLVALANISKLDYKQRKRTSIQYVDLFLQNSLEVNEKWAPFFHQHRKKDDLADCLIQIEGV